MSTIQKCAVVNKMTDVTPYVKMYGDEYFRKGWFGYKAIEGPDGVMSSGAMATGPKMKLKRGQIFTRRGSEFLPGWGTIAGNLTLTDAFDADLNNVMSQPNVHGVFWVDEVLDAVVATRWNEPQD